MSAADDDLADVRDESTATPPGPARARFAWCVTGSGHFLDESIALAQRLPDCDLLLSPAAAEVLPRYGHAIDALRPRFARVLRDKTASAIPVGGLYGGEWHTVVVAPATSNTVAKCALGISDTLPTNFFAQAGKLGIPAIVFACDTEPVVVTRAPDDWVTLRPRGVEFARLAELAAFAHCTVVRSEAELRDALARRLADLGLDWRDAAPAPGGELPATPAEPPTRASS